MTQKQKKQIAAITAFSIAFGICPAANAMHIMEGYLPVTYCVAWGVLCLPFLVTGFMKLKKTLGENRRALTLLAMSGAFIFVISSLKIPSVTGSCSHMTGTGLGAILFGPCSVSILGIIVLIFQAILLAHGGLTSLGANTFSMAIAGPFVSYGVYALCKKCNLNRMLTVFLAASIGDLVTYCVTSVQLALAYPSEAGGVLVSVVKFLGVFAPTQLPLAVVEGLLTTAIVICLESFAKPELKSIGYRKEV
ncbi:energy-coupling factor ABC transporter permease [Lachnospiraceae bacterium MD308]|nr:energy-coupling factor ABC transporter permease [Lachnospiraceae bacterium MD308]